MTQANQRRWGLVGLPRGYILLSYPGADSNDQTDAFRLTYPEATWGMIRRRAWLGSRALDYVLSQPFAHREQVAITGHSRNGKQSLIAAAYDQRITAVADSSSGSPAGSPYRLTSAWSEYTRNVPLRLAASLGTSTPRRYILKLRLCSYRCSQVQPDAGSNAA
jgi:hypothetical protein